MHAKRLGSRCAITLATLLMAMTVGNAGAGGKNPPVFPPTASPYGRTMAEWQLRDWELLLSTPYDPDAGVIGPIARYGKTHDIIHADVGAEWSITIPSGTALVFPLLSVIWSCPNNCGPGQAAPNGTVEELTALANASADAVSILELTIDGKPVPDLFSYRTVTDPWYGYAAEGNFFYPSSFGDYGPAVAGGYYVVIPPLSVGTHTIQILGVLGDPAAPDYVNDTTHHVTVVGGPVKP